MVCSPQPAVCLLSDTEAVSSCELIVEVTVSRRLDVAADSLTAPALLRPAARCPAVMRSSFTPVALLYALLAGRLDEEICDLNNKKGEDVCIDMFTKK